jgi:poly[(R)-3-hydroxyalkanoate] polymerase subunit PhaE
MTSDEVIENKERYGLEDGNELTRSLLGIWDEIMKLPTIGPLYSYFGNVKDEIARLSDLADTILKSQIILGQYWKQVNQAYITAIVKINEKTSSSLVDIKTKKDLDDYRKIMIDSFEEEFTQLFNSHEFAHTYRDLLDKQMDILRQLQESSQKTLGLLNLPTRKELDMISRDLHELRKSVMDLQDRLEVTLRKMKS